MMNRQLAALLAPMLLATGCGDFATAPDRTPAELRVSPDSVLLLTGEAAEFQVELVDESGAVYQTIPAWSGPLWSSDRPDRVDLSGGRVTPLLGGEQTLTVELAGLQERVVLRANPAEMSVSVPLLHITQGVQRTGGGVPIIAGRDGLLRVVVNGDDENYYRPRVRATFYDRGAATHSVEMELEAGGLPTSLKEGDLLLSYDAEVPGDILQPGVSLVVEVDPDGGVPAAAGSTLRIPQSGTLDLRVREVPPFRLRMVPVELAANGGRSSRLTPSYAQEVVRLTADIFPFGAFDMDVRAPYTTSVRLDNTRDSWEKLLNEIRLLRWDDGSTRYYYGGFDRPGGIGIGGIAYVGFPAGIGMEDRPDVIAHEIGHTLNLPHAPCGGPAGVDRDYPYPQAYVGQYGYDRTSGRLQAPFDRFDLMSYCEPVWISDYNYEKVIAYRATSVYDALSADGATERSSAKEQTLVVRGGVSDGELQLAPALEWRGRVALPPRSGRYLLEGLDAAGAVIFSFSLEPQGLDHTESSHFLVAVPAGMAQPDRLSRLRLSGPEGVVERVRSSRQFGPLPEVRLDAAGGRVASWDSAAFPLAVVRDRRTGLIRAMSETGTLAMPGGPASDFDVVLSDGLGTRDALMVQP